MPPLSAPAGAGGVAFSSGKHMKEFCMVYPENEASLQPAHDQFRPLALPALFALDIKPRGMVLDPIIPEKGLVMLYAVRGTGKTHVALGIALCGRDRSELSRWQAPKPRRVLLVDGEMPAFALRERLQSIAAAGERGARLLQVLAGDLIDGGIGNLAAPEVQAKLDPLLAGVDLLILDNLSSLTAGLRERFRRLDADSRSGCWGCAGAGLSVLIVHHAGKGGDQRGTSRREDVLDTSIRLRHSSDYAPSEGARFEIHIEKCRGVLAERARRSRRSSRHARGQGDLVR